MIVGLWHSELLTPKNKRDYENITIIWISQHLLLKYNPFHEFKSPQKFFYKEQIVFSSNSK
jgi:hypothetical protein